MNATDLTDILCQLDAAAERGARSRFNYGVYVRGQWEGRKLVTAAEAAEAIREQAALAWESGDEFNCWAREAGAPRRGNRPLIRR